VIQLTWDWSIFWAIVVSGALTGFVLGPQSWPLRQAEHIPPPALLALVMGLSVDAAFFLPLAVLRYLTGHTVELQATVLYAVYAVLGSVGLWLRGRLVR
jgi:hypothetical protein